MGREARPVLAEGPPTTSVLTSVRKQGATFSLVFWPQRKIRDAELVDCDPVERTRAPWTLSTSASIPKLYPEAVSSHMSEVYRHYYDHCSERKTPAALVAGFGFGIVRPQKGSSGAVASPQDCGFTTSHSRASADQRQVFRNSWTGLSIRPSTETTRPTAGNLNGRKMLALRMSLLLGLSWTCRAASGDPWGKCPVNRKCKGKFGDGSCDGECMEPECLRDGLDCLKDRGHCNPDHIKYCRDHYADSHCGQGCNNAPCGWDGSDCFTQQSPQWAKGTMVLHTNIPLDRGTFSNSSLLWALSVLLQSPLKLRGATQLATNRNLLDFDPQQLVDLLAQATPADSNGSLLFLQVDNRPCSRLPSTCFPYATEAASFLRAVMLLKPTSFPTLPELRAVVEPHPVWLWAVVALAIGLLLALPLVVFLVVRRKKAKEAEKKRRREPLGEDAIRMRNDVRETNIAYSKTIESSSCAVNTKTVRHFLSRDTSALHIYLFTCHVGCNLMLFCLKRGKEKATGRQQFKTNMQHKNRAFVFRPLKRDQDIGSDTDFTQSSMEDINARCSRRQEEASICDHRTQEQKHYRAGPSQSRRPIQRRVCHFSCRIHLISLPCLFYVGVAITVLDVFVFYRPYYICVYCKYHMWFVFIMAWLCSQSAEWCGPDGSVVLIRAVRSGLDRVVLELLRAGVPVNNTDHTGRSALHWACSVNHLSLTRTLIRYGAAVDLQDNKGETALFLSSLHGCYDTARLLLLHGANLELHDRRGRRPIDVAREGMRHQVLELLLAHQIQRGPVPVDSANEMMWEYSAWVGSQGLPGRSASFSGIVGHRDMTPPPQNDWSMNRVQYPSPQNWRPQINQSATALVPPRVMGRSPRPISTLQEVTSEDEDRDRHHDAPRAATPHFLSPQPAPRQRSFSCTQHALQHRSSAHQPEPNYIIVTDRTASETIERVIVSPPTDATAAQSDRQPVLNSDHPIRAEQAAVSSTNTEQKSRGERLNNRSDSTQTAL
ncbi:putative neurogenic locus notch -like protein 1-like [Scophthalmus maximus]|uniref:Putative neurogenic locus notch-like protein 1-like n=1 Tax=Scophthalmus maximus TaxID=52904 RepID=A0A2U9CHZ4_SCOMX|nr:putative neurogenic locus notch -like protein 1-like [Scophthalmus maximus]